MKETLLTILRCPRCGGGFRAEQVSKHRGEIEKGKLRCSGCGCAYPIADSIPRFVQADNYAKSFGLQWKEFRQTQLDSNSGQPISRNRFFTQSGWTPQMLSGRLVLDLGCGAGRFSEVSLSTGAEVVAVDYSEAVEACWLNLTSNPRVHVVQADLYSLPFSKRRFDFVYCFGVLQHTPDVQRAFRALTEQVAHGGQLAVDVYPSRPMNILWPKYWVRPLTRRIPPQALFQVVRNAVPVLLPLSVAIGRIPRIGRRLRNAVPVANYDGVLPLTREQHREWAILDTFDMLSPAHDHPQSVSTVRSWFEKAGFENIDVFRRGLVVGRGKRPGLRTSTASETQLTGHVGESRAR